MARADDTYDAGDWVEKAAVANYRDLIGELYAARDNQEVSLRQLAAKSGVALSAVSALETGSAWPRLNTMRAVASALHLKLHFGGDPRVAVALHRALRRRGKPRLWGGGPHDGEMMCDLAFVMGRGAGTLSELKDPTRSPSMRTVLAAAVVLSRKVELSP